MNIGAKIKAARAAANITQEQAAEQLGVTRQTVSNWENGKTYPDIISVIKMSDLYSISLDRLLKEEQSVSDYLDYLEESTNVVKSKNKIGKIILVAVYLTVWAISLAVFWLFTEGSDAMGFSLIFLWIVLSVATFIISLFIGANGYFGKLKWLCPLFFGVMHMLAEYATFSTANMIAFDKLNLPDPGMLIYGVFISLLGMVSGAGLALLIKRIKQ